MVTNIKGISSMKLHRLRKAYELGAFVFQGPVEADETYMGGKEASKHAHKKLRAGRGPASIRDCAAGKTNAAVVQDTTAGTLQQFVCNSTSVPGSTRICGMPGVQNEAVMS